MKSQPWSRQLKWITQQGVHGIIRHPMIFIVIAWMMVILLAVTIIPLLIVKQQPQVITSERPNKGITTEADTADETQSLKIAVYLTKEQRVDEIPLEQYIRGVVAAEMPIDFQMEALKAQAIAARTYIIRRYVDNDYSNVPVAGALVTDTVSHQAYLTDELIAKKWSNPEERTKKLQKLTEAVEATKDLVLTYEGQPILAAFFSTSNGYTENSEDYWSLELPYLRSVESPGEDELSPKFKTTTVFSIEDVMSKLKEGATPGTGKLVMKVIEYSEGQRIKRIQVGNQILTGREVRERLGLASTQFTWRVIGDSIEFTSYGSGHGVGMSQWGAEQMALSGKQAQEILTHYYKGVRIEKIHNLKSSL